ncbi:MAG: HsdR family type I site-specific deoxyribonuclease [Candidatus Diapherotrites archaeon]|nr:HsdR family type I site-specific deoxyribonuclease [Candidatus Diapherotrites archaeon]
MLAKTFTEQSMVEDYFIEKLQQEKKWVFKNASQLERESLNEPLLVMDLIRAIKRLNSDAPLTEDDIKKVVNELKFKSSGIEGAKHILMFFKKGVPITLEKTGTLKYIQLFDYKNIENNEFVVSRQVWYGEGERRIRVDIILYVNGIPLVIIECKNPADLSVSWRNAYDQIKEYMHKFPELFKYVQIGIAAEQIAKYFPVVPEAEDVTIYEWKEEGLDSIDATISMLTKSTILDLIKNFVFIREERGKTTKVIARYMQYRAANKIVNRVLGFREGLTQKKNGLIWHWQGSGKTLTMIFAANKLVNELGNPTIFFIVDRKELEEQLFKEFNALDITVSLERIEKINQLKEVLAHNAGHGKRGCFIALIQKFRAEEFEEIYKELEELTKEKKTILNRDDIIVFADEAHRTQYGSLASTMRGILQNAFFFAFTGTPISKDQRDTYAKFSYPPEELYLDKYFITDSIEDEFTLKIVYRPRLEGEEGIHLKKEYLEAFLSQEYEELPEDLKEIVKGKVARKLSQINVILLNQKRVGKVAEDIAEHFKKELDGKFKAMVVAPNRFGCILFKKELDKHLPEEYSEIVMTFNENDPQEIQSYLHKLKERYGNKSVGEIRDEVIEKFKDESQLPKILVVTDMLLTGFDAPILKTMYLNKPLKGHRLLQAIARTNRPYKDFKDAGLIIDYVGIFKELQKAFANYAVEDVAPAIYNMDEMSKEFADLIKELLAMFGDLPEKKPTRKTMLKAIEILTSDEARAKEFVQKYKKARKLFELLGSDPSKLKFFLEYKWLSEVYAFYIRATEREEIESVEKYTKKYFEKTVKHIYETTEFTELKKELPLVKFDANYIRNLEEKFKTDREKASDIVFTLNKFVLVEKYKNPVYESIADKVERIVRAWREKSRSVSEIYAEGKEIVSALHSLKKRQEELGLSNLQYSVLLKLEKQEKIKNKAQLLEDTKTLYNSIKELLFPGWSIQSTAKKRVGQQIRKFLRKYKELTFEERDKLYKEIMESVEQYG